MLGLMRSNARAAGCFGVENIWPTGRVAASSLVKTLRQPFLPRDSDQAFSRLHGRVTDQNILPYAGLAVLLGIAVGSSEVKAEKSPLNEGVFPADQILQLMMDQRVLINFHKAIRGSEVTLQGLQAEYDALKTISDHHNDELSNMYDLFIQMTEKGESPNNEAIAKLVEKEREISLCKQKKMVLLSQIAAEKRNIREAQAKLAEVKADLNARLERFGQVVKTEAEVDKQIALMRENFSGRSEELSSVFELMATTMKLTIELGVAVYFPASVGVVAARIFLLEFLMECLKSDVIAKPNDHFIEVIKAFVLEGLDDKYITSIYQKTLKAKVEQLLALVKLLPSSTPPVSSPPRLPLNNEVKACLKQFADLSSQIATLELERQTVFIEGLVLKGEIKASAEALKQLEVALATTSRNTALNRDNINRINRAIMQARSYSLEERINYYGWTRVPIEISFENTIEGRIQNALAFDASVAAQQKYCKETVANLQKWQAIMLKKHQRLESRNLEGIESDLDKRRHERIQLFQTIK